MHPTSERELQLARLLLAWERANLSGVPEENVPHLAERALTRLRRQFETWFGDDGTRAMMKRANDRARTPQHGLQHVAIQLDGTSVQLVFADDNYRSSYTDDDAARHLGTILSLVVRLVGEQLQMRLLEQIWPGFATREPCPIHAGSDGNSASSRGNPSRTMKLDAPDAGQPHE